MHARRRLTRRQMPNQVTTARNQWKSEEEGGVDDCTAIVCYLKWGRPSSGDASAAGSIAAGALHAKVASSNTSISRRAAGLLQSPAALWSLVVVQRPTADAWALPGCACCCSSWMPGCPNKRSSVLACLLCAACVMMWLSLVARLTDISSSSCTRRMSGTPLTMPPAVDTQADRDAAGSIPGMH
jgi:hypothetical protein